MSNNRIGIHQPYLFPYIGYFQLINTVDTFVIADDLQYMKGGWINRNKILMNGAPYMFTVPLHKASQNKLINEIMIKPETGWDQKFLRTLQSAYGRAPYFPDVFPLVEHIVSEENEYIVDLIQNSISALVEYLKIETRIVPSSTVYGTGDLQKEEIIFKIAKEEQANHYINLIGGIELYDKEEFRQEGLKLNFLEPILNPYPQQNDSFIERLSIIDVMMFNSPDKIKQMLTEYNLK